MPVTLSNEDYGLEAIITEGNAKHSHRAILRDTDADATVLVVFGTYEQALKAAKEFVSQ
jgi:hypothetical protein